MQMVKVFVLFLFIILFVQNRYPNGSNISKKNSSPWKDVISKNKLFHTGKSKQFVFSFFDFSITIDTD